MMKYNLCILSVTILIGFICPSIDALKCYTCTSSTDPNCITNVTAVGNNDCATETETNCFTRIDDNGVVERGCLSADSPTCTEGKCTSCNSTDICNNVNICKTCDSSTSPDCSQTDASMNIFNQMCATSTTKCIVNVKADKHIERRCATDADVTACTTATCRVCDGGNCNQGIFPTNRMECYQCDLTNEACLANTGIIGKSCLLYDPNDTCYMFGSILNTEQRMERGCMSDTTKTCSDANCFKCQGNNCNNRPYESSQSLKCIQCESTTENDGCNWGQDAATAQSCKNNILYNQEEMCFSQKSGNNVSRGCLYDRSNELGVCNDASNCVTCSGSDGCNSKDMNDFTCVRCRSDIDDQCRNGADKINGMDCRNSVTESTAKCFHGIWNDVVIRGCLVDADERMVKTCSTEGNPNKCEICVGKNCNTKSTSGVASMHSISLTGLVMIVLIGILNK